ncbi:calpain-1 catalytic subunit-like [Myripristis murdjan]|uniref:calpain-1 catalytic subunit-like n=1 Tax=Myripristis murdjan TaxID=586833 RepID=UPI0011763050|nr:calpain-1 catalytic subunit-like [Myripristis murdjan]
MPSTCVTMVNCLYEPGGVGSPSNPEKFQGQDYEQLKESLLSKGELFTDDAFPANLDSLGEIEGLTAEQLREVEWYRPGELGEGDPCFVVDGASRFDFSQGEIGNCWLLASFGSLTLRKSLMAQVVPSDQNFKDGYAGIFHFRFWRFGKWVDVVVDDLLPTRNFLPVSVSSKSGTEFWAPLMEKAYAKVCGSYGDMIAGNPSEAFMDFSGRVHMNYKLTKQPSDLWDVMTRATQAKTMMGCATYGQEKGKPGEEAGLVSGHAYAVTGVKQVLSEGMEVNLVRIWNPWGRKEWNGDWSDKSELWETVSSDVRDQCLKVRNDGEFWMTLEDYCVYYEDMDICCDSPNFLDDDAACQWKCSMKEGCWEAGESDVGSDCASEEFWKNPQFRIRVKAVEGESQGSKNILVSLMQKSDEEKRSKVEYHAIGFMIYEVPPEAPKGQLTASLMGDSSPLEVSTFCFAREIVELHSLQPGEYVIIPCTSEPEKTSSFILTIYSKAEAELE